MPEDKQLSLPPYTSNLIQADLMKVNPYEKFPQVKVETQSNLAVKKL